MKRTKEQSLSFFKTRKTSERGEGRELYKTRIHTIDNIIDSLLKEHPELIDKTWIDPCAADGIWLERAALKGIKKIINYDIKPVGESVIPKDFFTLNKVPPNSFIVGNPPYSLVKQFIEKSLEITDVCYFLGGSMKLTGDLSSKSIMLHRFEGAEGNQSDLRSKERFIDTNGKDVLVWTCGIMCDKGIHQPFKRYEEMNEGCFRVGIYKYCLFDERVVVLNSGKSNIYK